MIIYCAKLIIILMTENKYDLKCEILQSIFIENDYAFYLSGKFIFHLLFIISGCYYAFHGRVTLFFDNNSLMQCRITMKFLHNLFLNHEEFFSSHTMFIDTSTKEFTLVNNAFPSHHVAFEHFLYYKMVANVY